MPAAWAASSASATWPSRSIAALGRPAALAVDQLAAGRRPRSGASRRSARRRPRARRRPGRRRGGRGGRRAATRAGSGRGSPRRSASSRAITFSATGRSSAEVGRPVDDAHAAARDQRVEPVAGEGRADGEVLHRRRLYSRTTSAGPGPPEWPPRRRPGGPMPHRLPGDDRARASAPISLREARSLRRARSGGRWRRRSPRATPSSSLATKAATWRPSEEKTALVFEPSGELG